METSEIDKRLVKMIEKKINDYLKDKLKIVHNVRVDWKKFKSYPMYSSQYYAYVDLHIFYKELLEEVRTIKYNLGIK